MVSLNQPRIGVIGPSEASESEREWAEEIGYRLAQHRAVVLCGGLGGVMEAVAKGVSRGGGLCIGILPGTSRKEANPYVNIPIITGLGEGRNLILVRSAQALIAIGGHYGTLSEIAFALKWGVPLIGLNTWDLDAIEIKTSDPSEAVRLALEHSKR